MNVKSEIILLADRLIRDRGYHSFSYADISKPLNIRNAAIHYHFPTKADLGVAVINKTRESFAKNVESWRNMDPMQQVQKFIGIYKNINENNLVCFMGSLGPTYTSLPEIMRAALSKASDDIRSWMRFVLKQGKENGNFIFKAPIDVQADLIVTSLLASLVLNRVTGENILNNVSALLTNNLKK